LTEPHGIGERIIEGTLAEMRRSAYGVVVRRSIGSQLRRTSISHPGESSRDHHLEDALNALLRYGPSDSERWPKSFTVCTFSSVLMASSFIFAGSDRARPDRMRCVPAGRDDVFISRT
jgi:hypothetical protein